MIKPQVDEWLSQGIVDDRLVDEAETIQPMDVQSTEPQAVDEIPF